MSADEFLRRTAQTEIGAGFLSGLEQGYSWANTELKYRRQPPLYCPPQKVALTFTQVRDILSRYIESNQRAANDPLGLALLSALVDAFPCER
jgi:hypothetical protein